MICQVITGLKKTRFVCLLNLFGGRRRRGGVIYVFGVPLNGWVNGGSGDVFFTHGEYGFSSMRGRSYSKEWVWNLMIKLELNSNQLSIFVSLHTTSCGDTPLTYPGQQTFYSFLSPSSPYLRMPS